MLTRILTMALLLITSSAYAAHKAFHDNGIVMPYDPPAEHTDFLNSLEPDLAASMFAPPEIMDDWQDMRFGFFIHWDPSCQITGSMSWNRMGRRPHHLSDGTVKSGTPEEVYNSQYKTFNPTEFNAEAWVQLALDAGCKYMVFTSKHHNGFAMFDSAVSDYDIMSTPFARDICAELAAACQKHGLKLAWYFSQPDWTEERYRVEFPGIDWYKQPGWEDTAWNTYLTEFMYPQMRELYTKYGKIDGVWFDGLGKHCDWWRTPELMHELRSYNPAIFSNHRAGPGAWRFGDFDGPENGIGRFQINRPWESCMRMGGAWGYTEGADPLPIKDALTLLIRCAGNGGNLLLNTGPTPQGTIAETHAQRYREMGVWLRQYGESIYGTRGGPYVSGPWGCATRSKEDNTVYLHILGAWNGVLTLPDLEAKVVSAACLTGGEVQATQADGSLHIELNGKPDPINTIVALKLDRPAMELPVVHSVADASKTLNATATASSSQKNKPASNVVATTATDFDQGAFVRAVWKADGGDKQPWLQLDLDGQQTISQIQIQEGKADKPSNCKAFRVSVRVNDTWQMVHEGDVIGHYCGVVLPESVTTDGIRIDILERGSLVEINAIYAY